MSDVLIPDVKTDEGLLFLVAILVVGYAAWRAYQTGAGIAGTVTTSLKDAGAAVTSAFHSADATVTSVGSRVRAATSSDAAPGAGPDQSTAETARLGAADRVAAAGAPQTTTPIYDPMNGIYLGDVQTEAAPALLEGGGFSYNGAQPQLSSPSADAASNVP